MRTAVIHRQDKGYGMTKRDAACLAAILLLVCLFFHGVFLNPSKVLYYRYSDFCHFLIPQVTFVIDSLQRDGELPLWEPYAFSGKPPYGVPQLGVFYPFFIFVILTHSMSTYGFLFALNYGIAGTGMYLYVREICGRRSQALFSSLLFTFCGYMSARVLQGQYWHLSTIAWIPTVFLFAERIVKRRRVADGALLGGALAMQFLAGHTQYFFYSCVALCAYLAFRLLSESSVRVFARVILLLAVAAILFVLLAGIQILPAVEFSHYVYRANMHSFRIASAISLFPGDLPTFLFPLVRGSPIDFSYWGIFFFWEVCGYMGLLPLMCAAVAVVACRDRYSRFFTALLAFSLLFSMGTTVPIFSFFYYRVPGFNLFRVPSRMLAFYSFSFAIVSGYGVSAIGESGRRGATRRGVLFFLAVFGILLAGVLAFAALRGPAISVGKGIVAFVFNCDPQGAHTRSLAEWQALVAPHYDKIRAALTAPWQLINLTAAAIVCALLLWRRPGYGTAFAALCTASLIDLWSLGLPMVMVRSPNELRSRSGALEFLLRDRELFRVHDTVLVVPIEAGEPAGLFITTGFESVFLRYYIEFLASCYHDLRRRLGIANFDYEMRNYCEVSDIDFAAIASSADNLNFLDLLNVKYLTVRHPITRPGMELVYRTEGMGDKEGNPSPVFIYLNRGRMPRAWIVRRGVVAGNAHEALRLVKTIDPRREVVLSPPEKAEGGRGEFMEALVTRYSPNRIDVDVTLRDPGFLVLSEVWYPGWTAKDTDGAVLEVLRVNHCLRGVRLGPGAHRVVFEYRPRSYTVGMRMSMAGCALFCLLLGGSAASRRRERRGIPQ
jgi:hypothetical protein